MCFGGARVSVLSFSEIDLNGFDGVLIDLDDTLYAYEPAHQSALESVCAAAGFAERAEFAKDYRRARTVVVDRLSPQGACRSRLLAFQHLLETRYVNFAFKKALDFDRIYWSSFMDAMKLDAGALTFLKRCSNAKKPVCVVTDMTAAIQIEKLGTLGVYDFVDCIVTSEEVGAEKPDRRMFEAALRKLGLTPDRVLMIGDHRQKDVEGAEAMGIAAVQVRLTDGDQV